MKFSNSELRVALILDLYRDNLFCIHDVILRNSPFKTRPFPVACWFSNHCKHSFEMGVFPIGSRKTGAAAKLRCYAEILQGWFFHVMQWEFIYIWEWESQRHIVILFIQDTSFLKRFYVKYMALKSMRSGHFGAIFAAISTGLCRDAALPSTATKFEMGRPISPRKCFFLFLALCDLWPLTWHKDCILRC